MVEKSRADLDRVIAPPPGNSADSQKLAEEELNLFELEKQKLIVMGLHEDLNARRSWGNRVFWLLVGWLVAAFAVLVCQGFGLDFHLSDSVIITLITTTTANVLGLGYVVVNYLFPNNQP